MSYTDTQAQSPLIINQMPTATYEGTTKSSSEVYVVTDPAGKNMNNLTDAGYSVINNSKALETGAVCSDKKIYKDIYKYAHSTFDSSKFTAVGSPVINNKGIFYSTSVDNYPCFSANLGSGKLNFTTKVRFTSINAYTLSPILFKDGYNRIFISSSGQIAIFAGGNYSSGYHFINNPLTINRDYIINVTNDGVSSWTVSYTDLSNNQTVSETFTFEHTFINSTETWNISSDGSRCLIGEVDLEYLSIMVDGISVFSGNKTGVDTIKADNYTVVGTPAITDDGVASGFYVGGVSKGIVQTTSISLGSTFELKFKFKIPSAVSSVQNVMATNSVQGISLTISTTPRIQMQLGDGTQWVSGTINGTNNLMLNTEYFGKLIYNGAKYILSVSPDGETWTDECEYASATQFLPTGVINIGGERSGSGSFEGIIDLNLIQLYVDGNLVYQPCLKIPYTESVTGSKLSNMVYLPRIQSMYEQFGIAPYYTINETAQTFSLPQGEIYGIIESSCGKRVLKDSYRNGINYWEVYSDGTVEQGGSCTSGTAVNLLKPFADTNYVVTVPYSAKTKTSFTPSQTGDWIAKGQGSL